MNKFLKTDININNAERKLYLILFSVGFAFIFLNIFEPFGLYYDKNIKQEDVFIELFIALITAFIILLFSQFILLRLFKINRFVLYSYFLWFCIEAILVASAWFFLDIVEDKTDKNNLTVLWFENLFAYILVMSFPYFLYALIIHLKEISKENISFKSDNNTKYNPPVIINFTDETGHIKFALKPKNIIYIKSADNYVEIHYSEDEKTSKHLLRNSMKNIEKQIPLSNIIRCHRSFIVNVDKIETAKKTNSGFNLTLKHFPNLIIPVSKSYVSEFRKFIN